MPDRVDARVQKVQAAKRQAMIYRVFSKPQIPQLTTAEDPMLPSRQLGDLTLRCAKPSQPAYIAG